MKVPVLFCQENSIYKKLNCDVYDEKRNALNYSDTKAAIYHPPCRLWSKLRLFSKADEYEKYFAVWSVRMVRNFGGVLEHPAYSKLFSCCNIPRPGESDEYGFTIEVNQFDFGHKIHKKTWLYIVGLDNREILYYVKRPGKPKHKFFTKASRSSLPEISKHDKSATPIKFARYLIRIVKHIENVKKQPKFNNYEKHRIEERHSHRVGA